MLIPQGLSEDNEPESDKKPVVPAVKEEASIKPALEKEIAAEEAATVDDDLAAKAEGGKEDAAAEAKAADGLARSS